MPQSRLKSCLIDSVVVASSHGTHLFSEGMLDFVWM